MATIRQSRCGCTVLPGIEVLSPVGVRRLSETRKLLVAFDPARPDCQTSDFLIPWERDGQRVFLGLKSGKEATFGILVFVGRSVTENDLFTKLIETGREVANVDQALESLRSYLDALQALKIGNVARIELCCDQSRANGGLEVVWRSPSDIDS